MRGAGGGRPRKPAGQTRHRNKPTKDTIAVPASARVPEPPEPMVELDGTRRRVWDAMWATPVATLWDRVDVPVLTRLVMLQCSKEALLDKDLLTEMRHLEDRFLLNPYARAQQRVVIEGTGQDDVELPDVPDLDEYRRRALGTS
jgi:hypothetical protein